MSEERLKVLFICTGNSARSQMAEAMLRLLSDGKIDVYSAGSEPRDRIHPLAQRVMLEKYGIDMEANGQYPKSIEQFVNQKFHYIIAVCNRAAEACPYFPGDPERINWFYDDPAAVEGTEEQKYQAFVKVARELSMRIRTWVQLPQVARGLRIRELREREQTL
ncbi:MAG: arsenate reductase ArsC [Anaerolineae bacterium]|nr:arsenate reductase ArsC [Thermoflexales bacterium]MDW8407001.1 arsenate reductase ArsC [Anaerolineae bacterium]